jgi:hypothetical protein
MSTKGHTNIPSKKKSTRSFLLFMETCKHRAKEEITVFSAKKNFPTETEAFDEHKLKKIN